MMEMSATLSNFLSNESYVPLAFALIAVVYLMSSLRKRQQRDRNPKPPTPAAASGPGRQDLRRDVDELMVELQELSRRITAEIDTRFARLETAIRDADRRIAVLSRLSRGESDRRPNGGEDPRSEDARHAVIYEMSDAGFSPIEIARDLGKTPGEVELILNLRRPGGMKHPT